MNYEPQFHEKEVARYLQKLLKKHDISAKILRFSETRGDLIAEIGSGKRTSMEPL